MRNRAKCKLCESVIEALHINDLEFCNCGEINVDGSGAPYRCGAKNWDNFIRIDDQENEIIPKIIDKTDTSSRHVESDEIALEYNPSSEEKHDKLCCMLKGVIDSYDNLPQHAKLASITHYDLQAALLIIYEIVRK